MKFTAPRPTGVLRVATRSPYVETDAEQCWLYRRDSGEFGEQHGVRHGVLLAGQPRHPGHAAHPGDDVVGRRGGDDVVRRVPRRVQGVQGGPGEAQPSRGGKILGQPPGRLSTVGSSSIPGSRRTGSGWEPWDRRVVVLLDAPEQAAAAICRRLSRCRGLPCSCVGRARAPRVLWWALGERTRGHPDRVSERSGRRLAVLPGGLRRRSPQPHSCPLRPAGGVVGGGRHGGQQGSTGSVRGGVEQLGAGGAPADAGRPGAPPAAPARAGGQRVRPR